MPKFGCNVYCAPLFTVFRGPVRGCHSVIGGTSPWLLHMYAPVLTAICMHRQKSVSSRSNLLSFPNSDIGVPSVLADEPNFGGVAVGGSVSGVIDYAGDTDLYTVSLIAGQTYSFSLRGTGATPISDSLLAIFTPAGAFINQDDDGGNDLFSILTYTATQSGNFFIGAQSFPNAGDPGLGGYTVDVRVQGADAVGNTNATSVAIGIGTTFGFREAGSTDVPPAPFLAGDLDRYSVNLVAGQYYTFKLAGGADYATNPDAIPTGELDTFLILRNAAGGILATNDDNAFPSDLSSTIGFYAVTGGTYYIDATAYAGQTGGYALEFNQVDLTTLKPLDSLDWRNANDIPFVNVGGVPTAYVYFGAAGENFGETGDDGVTPMVTLGWRQNEIDAVMLALEQYEQVLGTNYVITTDITQATFRLSTTVSSQYGAYFYPQDPGVRHGAGHWRLQRQQRRFPCLAAKPRTRRLLVCRDPPRVRPRPRAGASARSRRRLGHHGWRHGVRFARDLRPQSGRVHRHVLQ